MLYEELQSHMNFIALIYEHACCDTNSTTAAGAGAAAGAVCPVLPSQGDHDRTVYPQCVGGYSLRMKVEVASVCVCMGL